MDILGIGPLELIVILIIALAIFGPEKLPEIGAKLGKGMQHMRRATREFSKEIEKARETLDPDAEISDSLKEIGGAVKGTAALAQATRNPGQAIRDSVMRELKAEPAAEAPPTPARTETHDSAPAQEPAQEPEAASEITPAPSADPEDPPPTEK